MFSLEAHKLQISKVQDAVHYARRLIFAFDIFTAIRYLFADDVTLMPFVYKGRLMRTE